MISDVATNSMISMTITAMKRQIIVALHAHNQLKNSGNVVGIHT
jgi:hypothetical protein